MPFKGSNLGHLDLDLLTTLVALVDERSTTGAARRLNLAQSTVSGALARLRLALGDPLLVREGRAMEPTARALELVEAARPHLEALAAAVADARPFDPARDARTFRFGCTDAVALTILPVLSARLRQAAPKCDLVVRLGDFLSLPGMLATGDVATVLAYLRDDPPANAKLRVLRHSPWVVLRDPAQPPIDGLDDFCIRSHALVSPSGDLAGFVDRGLEAQGRTRRVVASVGSFALLLALIPGSDLVSTVPDFVARRLAALGGLAIDPCPVEVPKVINSLAWRAAVDRDAAERWFRDEVMAAFREDRSAQVSQGRSVVS